MEEPGKLYDFIGDVPSYSDDPALTWEQAGARIAEAVATRRARRRRRILWWFSGLSCLLVLLVVAFISRRPLSDTAGPAPALSSLPMEDSTSSTAATPAAERSDRIPSPEHRLTETARNQGEQTAARVDQPVDDQLAKTDESSASQAIRTMSAERDAMELAPVPSAGSLALPKLDEEIQGSVEEFTRSATYSKVSAPPAVANSTLEQSTPASLLSAVDVATERAASGAISALPVVPQLALRSEPRSLDTLLVPLSVQARQAADTRFSLFFWGGPSLTNLDRQFAYTLTQLGSYAEFGMSYRFTKHFSVSGGLAYSLDRLRTDFVQRTPLTLYRPGTPDTIYRYATGQEVVVTTDSVPGLRVRRFRHQTSVEQFGIPVQLGYGSTWRKFTVRAELGLMPVVLQRVRGIVANPAYELTDLSSEAKLAFQLGYRLAVGAEVPCGPGRLGLRYVLTHDPDLSVGDAVSTSRQAQSLQIGYRWYW